MAKLFFSYSHKDEELRNELETHLALLKRQGVISSWHDRRIIAGSELDKTISTELETANIILLLISAHFLASDYCYEKEMMRAVEKHNEGDAKVIPVILHPCDWHSAPFGNLRATPTDGKPVSMFANQHEAFSIIAKDVREAAESMTEKNDSMIKTKDDSQTKIGNTPKERSSNLRIKKKFDDQEKDEFIENSYEYILRYFEGSLEELRKRNTQIKTKLKRVSATSFSAFIYDNGERVAQCSIYYGESSFRSQEIAYSNAAEVNRKSYNETMRIVEDGYTLQLKPLGMQMFGRQQTETYTQEGAAEYYWSIFISVLQEQ
ncbi:MAG: toll/interleukin-1 receptor domain-containing protein [Melioribacteraceae bacterium]|nr:MAG: toll/interleukin-1 receptor domain-containing protein [Melioribacteraceae bacterium]